MERDSKQRKQDIEVELLETEVEARRFDITERKWAVTKDHWEVFRRLVILGLVVAVVVVWLIRGDSLLPSLLAHL